MKKSLILFSAVLLAAMPLTGCGGAAKIQTAEDLKGKVIGTQQGTTGYIYACDVENAQVEPYNTCGEAIDALLNGDVDAVIIDADPANVFVEKNAASLEILNEPFSDEEYAIAYSNENFALGKKLGDALAKLKEDGTISDINTHWIGGIADEKPYEDKNPDTSGGVLVMGTNPNFPPYENTVDGNIVGIDVDIMTAICDELNMELKIEEMEFDSIIANVAAKKVDVGVAAITITRERANNVSFTEPYATSKQVIVVKKQK